MKITILIGDPYYDYNYITNYLTTFCFCFFCNYNYNYLASQYLSIKTVLDFGATYLDTGYFRSTHWTGNERFGS